MLQAKNIPVIQCSKFCLLAPVVTTVLYASNGAEVDFIGPIGQAQGSSTSKHDCQGEVIANSCSSKSLWGITKNNN